MTLMLWLLLILLVPFSQPLENAGSPAPASVSSTGEIFASADAMLVNVSQSETTYDAGENLTGHANPSVNSTQAVGYDASADVIGSAALHQPLDALSAKEERLWSIVTTNSLDFDAWTDLIDETESTTELLFERALQYVGSNYLCFPVWDKYIEFEISRHDWSHVATIYKRVLEIPNQQLDRYFEM
ncbi:hypothetical protein OROHE_006032 [Orobanche hederae]